MNVPLAEHFHSVQGEGHWAGTPMHFFRFPGCNVGRNVLAAPVLFNIVPEEERRLRPFPEAKQCTAWNGTRFWCDTDYAQHLEEPSEKLIGETYELHACFTGGEPLIHQRKVWFKELLDGLRRKNVWVHVETSGTVPFHCEFDWVTVSPKLAYDSRPLQLADQVKLLVDENFVLEEAEALLKLVPDAFVFLSPIFDPNSLVKKNVEKCFEALRVHPEWRLSVQWHKWLGVR